MMDVCRAVTPLALFLVTSIKEGIFHLALTESQYSGHYSTNPVGMCSHHSILAIFPRFSVNLFSAILYTNTPKLLINPTQWEKCF